jgi:glycosyltransferase involved in cell wall biosynthesis
MQSTRTIAVVSDSVMPFHKGGKEARIYNLTRELSAQGNDVHIYTMKWWDGPKSIVIDGITHHAICRLYPLYAGSRRSITQGILFGLSGFKLLAHDFDILEVDHMPFFPLYSTKIVSLLKRKPLIATWHEVWGRKYWHEYLGHRGLIAYLIEKVSVSLPDRIVAVSAQTADELRNVLGYRGALSIVTNGIDYEYIDSVTPSLDESDIIFTGRLIAHKQPNLLIDAVAIIAQTNPEVRCLIIGDGPERDNLARQVARLHLDSNVTLIGRVESNRDVYAAMKSSRVFVLPSLREGFGITVIEAFACGLPVVTIDHPTNAARLLIEPGNGLVSAPTASALAASIAALLDAPRVGAAISLPYDWAELAMTLNEVYAQ